MKTRALTREDMQMVAENCLCLRVQRASRAIARKFDEALRPSGLNNYQFSLLTAVNRPNPATIGALAETLGVDRTTITANLKPLEREGLVRLERDRSDARAKRIVITHAGRARLSEAYVLWRESNEDIISQFGKRDLAGLRQGLQTLAALDG